MSTHAFDPEVELSQDVRTRFFIDGAWRVPQTGEMLDIVSPVTETVSMRAPAGAVADMEQAVAAARRAFDTGPWARMTPQERAPYLRRIGEEVRKREALFQRVWMAQMGVPRWFAESFTQFGHLHFDYYSQLSETYPFEEVRPIARGSAKVVKEPVGVCALILPWNAPLLLLTQKMSAALLAGCTMVVKPSPETPFDALLLAECVAAAGVPAGVVNVVQGGREVGDWLIRQPRIDKVSFTGSTAAGKHISAVCADRIARVSLELGGKSASILCEDADMDDWLKNIAPFTMPISGQVCWSQTRVLVPKSRHDAFVEAFVDVIEGMTVGDPWLASTRIGPLAMSRQRERVLGYIDIGKQEGAKLLTGGGRHPEFDRGYYVSPTVFDGVTNDMRIAQEEIFGPVVSVITYDDDEDAIRIANDSNFGLSGSVFSTDLERAERIARRMRTGNVSLNTINLDPSIPFGGFKQSGMGREAGPEGLDTYLELKSIYRS